MHISLLGTPSAMILADDTPPSKRRVVRDGFNEAVVQPRNTFEVALARFRNDTAAVRAAIAPDPHEG